jgi:hypothetical protein
LHEAAGKIGELMRDEARDYTILYFCVLLVKDIKFAFYRPEIHHGDHKNRH